MEKYLMLQDGKVVLIHNMPFDATEGLRKSRAELLATGIFAEELPKPEQREGYTAVLMHNETKGLYYEYEAAPETEGQAAARLAIDAYTLQLIENGVI